MKVVIPDHEVRSFLRVGRRANINASLMDWLYRDPRFDAARERLMAEWLMHNLRAQLQAGIDVSGGEDSVHSEDNA